MHRASTFCGPKARTASAQDTAESMPPESPSTARDRPALPTSSRRKLTRIHSTSGASMASGLEDVALTCDPLEVAEGDVEALVAEHRHRRAAAAQHRGIERQQVQLRLHAQRGQRLAVRPEDATVAREGGAVLHTAAIHVDG